MFRLGAGNLELLSSGRVPANHWDWEYGKVFRFKKAHEDEGNEDEDEPANGPAIKKEEEEDMIFGRPVINPTFQAAAVSIPVHLAPADGFRTPYTNYVRG